MIDRIEKHTGVKQRKCLVYWEGSPEDPTWELEGNLRAHSEVRWGLGGASFALFVFCPRALPRWGPGNFLSYFDSFSRLLPFTIS